MGLRLAGFRVPYVVEFLPDVAECYRAMWPSTHVEVRDVRELAPGEILAALGIQSGELDVLEGSPPCKAFSSIGIGVKGWGKEALYSGNVSQRADDLFPEYFRLVRGLQPRIFVAENVAGLARGAAKGVFREILQAGEDAGYRVEVREINCAYLGVPQRRTRLFIVGVREDLDVAHRWPSPSSTITTLEGVLDAEGIVTLSRNPAYRERVWTKRAPSPTLSTMGGRVVRPKFLAFDFVNLEERRRSLRLEEVIAISGLPPDVVLPRSGNIRSDGWDPRLWEFCARAIPPRAYEALGLCLREMLDEMSGLEVSSDGG